MNYQEFLSSKTERPSHSPLSRTSGFGESLFPFQRDIVEWAARLGRAAIFGDCGIGKTLIQLEWASADDGITLIAAPLAVSDQTIAEGERFGIEVKRARDIDDVHESCGIWITNYERLGKFGALGDTFSSIVLDESSILKSFAGKTRNAIIAQSLGVPHRLA
ncbi:MAG TPA: hypothetical protein VFG22_00875, partial [Polyangiales bacterium]|nr:hypothetical protein [Polyangiales bacterium]